ncbi:MAG: peptidoglycan editing factor PgeF [Bacteroidetes Order II. Incertae sedis bacterium]|nr:peptidoglycan editing factor PgeF [Bacteroidetes Order II. bacterium]
MSSPVSDPIPSLIRPQLFSAFSGLTAGFTTRRGGYSQGPFDSLNLGINTADDPEVVAANHRLLARELGFDDQQLVLMRQVHSGVVQVVNESGIYTNIDGVVTSIRGLLLMVGVADCAAVLIADPQSKVVGACHSGWKGTVANITAETIRQMQALGATPSNMYAWVSPCISTTNFEVGEEVAKQFDPAFVHRSSDWPKPHVDIKACIVQQAQTAGIPLRQIAYDPACTVAEVNRFFSYRAEKGHTGRLMGFIGLTTEDTVASTRSGLSPEIDRGR